MKLFQNKEANPQEGEVQQELTPFKQRVLELLQQFLEKEQVGLPPKMNIALKIMLKVKPEEEIKEKLEKIHALLGDILHERVQDRTEEG